MPHIYLVLSCLALLGVIAAQDWLYAPLRNETISAGLTGPYHWWLDAAYVPVSLSVALSFAGHPWMEVLGVIAAISLLLVAATNTFHVFVDKITKGQHALWHSRFTLVVFCSVLLLEVLGDHGWRWWLTALNVAIPAACYGYFHFIGADVDGTEIAASPAAEKLYVLGLSIWLIVWTL